jgi:hypothetical protein
MVSMQEVQPCPVEAPVLPLCPEDKDSGLISKTAYVRMRNRRSRRGP